jgi:hypothetical protein
MAVYCVVERMMEGIDMSTGERCGRGLSDEGNERAFSAYKELFSRARCSF